MYFEIIFRIKIPYIYTYMHVFIGFARLFNWFSFPKFLVYGVNDLVVAMPQEMCTNQSVYLPLSVVSVASAEFQL